MANKRIMTPEEKVLLQQNTDWKKSKQETVKRNVMPEHAD